jgi:putative lipoic acid-binding regulatory protein
MSINEQLWDFPHRMKLKVMGPSDSPLEQAVTDILNHYLDDFDAAKHLSTTPSAKGNYISVTCHVVMRDREQVEAIYRELNACPHSRMVL